MSDPFADITPRSYSYRASELGSCIKRLAAARMGLKPWEGTPEATQKLYDRGNAHETVCLSVMKSEGWQVWGEQQEVNLVVAGLPLSGHLDGITRIQPGTMDFVAEIKSPYSWHRFVDEMWSDNPSPLTQHYKWQISFYMVALNKEALLICLDDDYQLRYHGIEVPFYDYDAIKDRIETIESIVASGQLPRLCSVRDYPCPFFHLHEDDNMEYTVDSAIDELVARRAKAIKNQKMVKKEIEYCNRIIIETMAGRKEVVTTDSKVVLYNRSNTRYDYKKMRQDGIPVDDYKTTTETKDIPRIAYKGEEDD